MPPVPLRNLQHDIDPGGTIQNLLSQNYKAKYEETVWRLHNVEAKYNNLLHQYQAYLLKTLNPIDPLTVHVITLLLSME
jgi:DNA-binding transcriptional regulator PaaX